MNFSCSLLNRYYFCQSWLLTRVVLFSNENLTNAVTLSLWSHTAACLDCKHGNQSVCQSVCLPVCPCIFLVFSTFFFPPSNTPPPLFRLLSIHHRRSFISVWKFSDDCHPAQCLARADKVCGCVMECSARQPGSDVNKLIFWQIKKD